MYNDIEILINNIKTYSDTREILVIGSQKDIDKIKKYINDISNVKFQIVESLTDKNITNRVFIIPINNNKFIKYMIEGDKNETL